MQSTSVYQMFRTVAEKKKEDTALICQAGKEFVHISYRQLSNAVDELSEVLYQTLKSEGNYIGVYTERSADTLISLLAILKTGNIYVPIDMAYPDNYIRHILNEVKPSVVLTRSFLNERLEKGYYRIQLLDFLNWEDLKTGGRHPYGHQDLSHPDKKSLLMYTSGTTGKPKGIEHKQRGIINKLDWLAANYPLKPDDIAGQRTSVNFLPSVCEFLNGLLQGIPTAIINDGASRDAYQLTEVIEKLAITVMQFVPSLLKRMLEIPEGVKKLSCIRLAITCGEPLSYELYHKFNQMLPGRILLNDYGSTETDTMLYMDNRSNPGESGLPDFHPIPNMKVYIINEERQLCKLNETGMLYTEGASIALGYFNLPEENKDKFINGTLNGQVHGRLYKTGDLAVYTKDGGIRPMGRADQQVKIRGVRIELAAIEKTLSGYDFIKECCVVAKEPSKDVKILAAYVVMEENCSLTEKELKDRLRQDLPEYMIPSQIIYLDTLPRTLSGKISRSKLPDEIIKGKSQMYMEVEYHIRKIISDLLAKETSGIDNGETFRDLGLDSLTIVDFLNKLNASYGTHIQVSEVYDYATTGKMAGLVCEKLQNDRKDAGGEKQKQKIKGQEDGRQNITDREVAIIGISGRFPGAAHVNQFWDNLLNKKVSIGRIPISREQLNPGMAGLQGGFLENIDQFDASFFDMSSRECLQADPQHRLCLEECFKALEDAGCSERELKNKKTGVFVGAGAGDYARLAEESGLQGTMLTAMGSDSAVLAARLPYFLNLKGAAVSVNTACSSSLAAMHFAYRSIQNGDCDIALACGANIMNTPELIEESKQMGILSPEGNLKVFDNLADGTVLGEGIGVVVLKRLSAAVEDRNQIYGVIAGSGMNQDGRTDGLTAPSAKAQQELMKTVYDENGICPGDITYIECHGTGTKLGDPIEMQSIFNVFRNTETKMYISSVKSNIGHTVTCSGIAGVIKLLLAMKHGIIPPQANFDTLNCHMEAAGQKLIIPKQPVKWISPKTAAINAFGYSGTNVHMVIKEYPGQTEDKTEYKGKYIIPVSAKSKTALEEKRKSLYHWLFENKDTCKLADLAYTLQSGRIHFTYRNVYVVQSKEELLLALEEGGQVIEETPCIKQYLEGQEVDFSALKQGNQGSVISLPSYPFEYKKYWILEPTGNLSPGCDRSEAETLYYETELIPSKLTWNQESFSRQNKVLVLGNQNKIDFSEVSQAVQVISGQKDMDYGLLLRKLNLKQQEPVYILHLLSLEPAHSIEDQLENGIFSMVKLSKALMQVLYGEYQVRLLYVFANTRGNDNPVHAGVCSFIRTINLENSRFRFKSVELRGEMAKVTQKLLTTLLLELDKDTKEIQILYDQDTRYIARLKESRLTGTQQSYQGNYIITGGLGGIGHIIAGNILKHKGSRIIILGRSELAGQKKELFDSLKKIHPDVEYQKADVTDEASITRCIEAIRLKYKTIDGVVHCAGMIKDKLLRNKPLSEFYEVIQAKVYGIINLDKATAQDKLRFFTAFSSITSAFGNAGQSDYAYGNGFMDQFVMMRNELVNKGLRYGKSQSIQWPLWENGNMAVSREAIGKMEREKGMVPLTDDSGFRAFDTILGSPVECVAVLYGKSKAIGRYITGWSKEVNTMPELQEHVAEYITRIISGCTGIPLHELDPLQHFEELGMNSMMMMEILECLEEKLSDIPKTLLFEYLNIKDLANYLTGRYQDVFEKELAKKDDRQEKDSAVLQKDGIAVIGIHGRYPMAENLSEFWENLKQGKDCITEIPGSRWDYRKFYNGDKKENGKVYAKWGGFLNNIDQFDPLYFHISPKEAQAMDPQERLFLEAVKGAMDDAGYSSDALKQKTVGVYAGVMWGHYQLYGTNPGVTVKPTSSFASIANRVSYIFDFKGPSMAVDTMCSSSITAIKLACDSLKNGETDYAVAGGVNLIVHPYKYDLLCQGHFASTDGRCRSFGEGGDGYVPGEGVGAVLLKPLKKAIQDKDYIYGIIRDVNINHGGKTNGYTVPSPQSQCCLIKESLDRSGVAPRSVSYIEAHGTGTALGDPIEIEGIRKAFESHAHDKQYCSIGSVKSNIGHLEAAAGMASLTKVLLQMKYHTLVPSLHGENPNPNIDFKKSPVYLQQELSSWESGDNQPLRAGISSFGAGGANGFMLLEEYIGAGEEKGIEKSIAFNNPYHKERYWLDCEASEGAQKRENTDRQTVKQSDPQIKDHCINGQVIYPAAAIVRNAWNAVAALFPEKTQLVLEELVLLRPITFTQEELVIETAAVRKDESISFTVSVNSCQDQFYAKGKFREARAEEQLEHRQAGPLPEQFDKVLDKSEFYRYFDVLGITYGTQYQTIDKICVGNGAAVAYHNGNGNQTASVDGILQAQMGLMLNQESACAPLPYLIKGLNLIQPVPEKFITYAYHKDGKTSLIAMDMSGTVFLKLEELIMRERKQKQETNPSPVVLKAEQEKEMLEEWIREIISSVTKVPINRIQSTDEFEWFGIDSLMLMDMEEQLEKRLDRSSESVFFKYSTIRDCVDYLLRGETAEPVYSLTEGQKGIYSFCRMFPESCAYHTPGAYYLKDHVELPILENALKRLVKRHEILRAAIVEKEDGIYAVIKDQMEVSLPVIEVQGRMLRQKLAEINQEVFSLEHGPLWKAVILKEEDKHKKILFLSFHHIIFDGSSSLVLYEELKNFYESLVQGIEPVNTIENSYQTYVAQEQKYLGSTDALRDRDYWLKQISKDLPRLSIGANPLENGVCERKAAAVILPVEQQALQAVKNIYIGKSTTQFTKLLAAYMLLLYQMGNETDISVGTPVSNRGNSYSDAVGYYMNLITIRHKIDPGDTYKGFLIKLSQTVSESMEHRRYPYYTLVNQARKEKNKTIFQLFQAAFYYNHWSGAENGDFYDRQLDEVHQLGEYDLVLEILKNKERGLSLRFKYNQTILSRETILEMKTKYEQILLQMGINQDQSINTGIEEAVFPALFAQQARKTPEACALLYQGTKVSYHKLYQYARRIAVFLIQKGLTQGEMVGVCMERTPELLECLIGVQLAGGVYLPLDPKLPIERLKLMVKQSEAAYLITDQADPAVRHLVTGKVIFLDDLKEALLSRPSFEYVTLPEITEESLAYVLFTSGTTGNPKGIMIGHGSLGNLLLSMKEHTGCTQDDHMFAMTTISFDISGLELYLMLIAGGTVEILPDEVARDGIALLEKIEASPVTMIQATPAAFRMLLTAGWEKKEKGSYKLLCGGEALTDELAAKLLQRSPVVWNLYGPTETTIWSTIYQVEADKPVYLGKPIHNTSLYVLDQQGQEVKSGETGELYIGGAGVAKGYIHNTEETKEKFLVMHHIAPETLYKTGDLVKKTEDGELQYIGRLDTQVKKNGYRIELGEIEEALAGLESISEAVVVLRKDKGLSTLAAFLIGNSNRRLKEEELKEQLKKELPGYMIPTRYWYLKSYPYTWNQKIDRKKLATAEIEEVMDKNVSKDSIKSVLKEEIAAIQSLETDSLDENTDLGAYGFDSISFTSLSLSIQRMLGIKISPTVFYTETTIEKISQYLYGKRDNLCQREEEPRHLKNSRDIAVIGIGAVLPGANNVTEFWGNLVNEIDSVTEIPKTRFDWEAYPLNTKWGGFIQDADKFDGDFYHISAREAKSMDPQQRIMLMTVEDALENAGYHKETLSGKDVGVFIGATSYDYLTLALEQSKVLPHTLTGITNAIIANRISYLYNFNGPSELIDTACSSGLTAVCRAVEALRNGSCHYAIAGGVNLLLSPFPYIALSQAGMLSADGACKTFDKKADGYVRGEGSVAIVLKPLAHAINDRDHIYGVIKGVAVNHCGKTNSLTAPSANPQKNLIKKAFHDGKIDPSTVSYIECHGTGTALGDPIEVEGLIKAFAELHEESGMQINKNYCGLGSVKTNIGHLEAASGITGLLKLILSISNKLLPANLHFEKQNPYLALEDTPFYLLNEKQEWSNMKKDNVVYPLRGGVSAFGFGGSNAHVIVEEYIPAQAWKAHAGFPEQVVVLSAGYSKGLIFKLEQLLKYLETCPLALEHDRPYLQQIAYTLQTGREPLQYRIAFLTSDIAELKEQLSHYLDNQQPDSRTAVQTGTEMLNSGFLERTDLSQLADTYLKDGNLWKAANLWVHGIHVNWSLLYQEPVEKLPLPGYPFQKERYWLDGMPDAFSPPVNRSKLARFTPVWQKVDIQDLSLQLKNPGQTVIFYKESSEGLKNQLLSVIQAGQVAEINLSQWTGYLDYENYIMNHPVKNLYYLGGFKNQTGQEEAVGIQAVENITSYLYLLKALKKSERNTNLCVLTNQVFQLSGEDNACHAAMYPISKTAMLENELLHIRLYDLDFSGDTASALSWIAGRQTDAEQMFMRGGHWYQRRVLPLPDQEQGLGTKLKKNGVYVIIGMGGIGKEIGLYLACNYQAAIIYIGLSAVNEEKTKHINRIYESGGCATYIQTDITDASEVTIMMKRIKKIHAGIDGVFFGAMVLLDQKIENMAKEHLSSVFHPKVLGLYHILTAFRNEAPDFILILSSVNSFLGNFGQANYNGACIAQDLLGLTMKKRWHMPVKIMNFSYWGKIGSVSDPRYESIMKQKGIHPITPEEGVKEIESFLAGDEEQVIVCKGEENVFAALGFTGDSSQEQDKNKPEEALTQLEHYGVSLIIQYLQGAGMLCGPTKEVSFDELKDRLEITASYEPLLKGFLEILTMRGYLSDNQGRYHATEKMMNDQFVYKKENEASCVTPYRKLLEACAAKYKEILSGKLHYTQAMFPDGSKRLVEQIYKGNELMDAYNQLMAQTVAHYISETPGKKICILEIGAGTGGASHMVLKEIREEAARLRYIYSDISASFTAYGKNAYKDQYPFMEFSRLDIEEAPISQGFMEDMADIILASNVLHATKDIRDVLRNIKSLLRPGGLLVLNELTRFNVFSTCTFGLTEDWWKAKDQLRISHSPLLQTGTWKQTLAEEGFEEIHIMPKKEGGKEQPQHIITARKAENPHPAARMDEEEALPGQTVDWLKQEFSSLLMCQAQKLEENTSLEQMGLDSLLIMEIHKKWSVIFKDISPVLLYEANTINKLKHYLLQNYKTQLKQVLLKQSSRTCYQAAEELRQDNYFIRDHKIKGNYLLPAVMYLNLAAKALEGMDQRRQIRYYKDILWIKPILIERKSQNVTTKLTAGDESVAFDVLTEEDGLHASGKLVYGEYPDTQKPVRQYQNFHSDGQKTIHKQDFYKLMSQCGYEYGDSFQPVEKICYNDNQATGFLKLPLKLEHDFSLYQLHPVLLEGCLQIAGYVLNQAMQPDHILVPLAIDEIEIIGVLKKECMVQIEIEKPGQTANLVLCNQSGEAVVKIKNYRVGGGRTSHVTEKPDVLSYEYHYYGCEPYVRDHSSFGKPVLLGVTYASLAVESVKKAFPELKGGLEISRFVLTEPVVIEENESVCIRIELEEQGRDQLKFRSIYKKDGEDQYKESSNGIVSFIADSGNKSINLEKLIQSYDTHDDAREIYDKKWPGVYGPSLRTLQNAYVIGEEVAGELRVSDKLQTEERTYSVHPAILDGSMTARCALLKHGQPRIPFIPIQIKRIQVYGNTDTHCYCHLLNVKIHEEIWEMDIRIYGEDGSLQVELLGFQLKKVNIWDQKPEISQSRPDDIAIIGLSGVLPGCSDLDEFWKAIQQKKDLIREIPIERFDWKEYKDLGTGAAGRSVDRGGFIKDADKFDHSFFGLSPREAKLMDPQQRIILELAWKAIEDAGYPPEDFAGSNTGVFIGVAGHDYSNILNESDVESDAQALTGNAHNILTGRISYLLDLHGPSEPVDTACSSSFAAIHHAIRYILDGTCDMALAGGINIIAHPALFEAFDSIGILSKNGICRAFDDRADGTVRGEGGGVLLLKPFKKAVEDHDHIYAVIKGSAINHAGHTSSLTAPGREQQTQVIMEAITKAGIPPETISYVETHGTGTVLGDPIEVEGLKSAFSNLWTGYLHRKFEQDCCGLGAVKNNIGHLETASGIAGILKVILCMKHQTLPGNTHFKNLNPYIKLEHSPFYMLQQTNEWKHLTDDNGKVIPYRAGISAFGFSGVNSHIILEEYIQPEPAAAYRPKKELIVISAQDKEDLVTYITLLKKAIKQKLEEGAALEQIAYTLQISRSGMKTRAAFLTTNPQELFNQMDSYIQGEAFMPGIYHNQKDVREGKNGNNLDITPVSVKQKSMEEIAVLWTEGVSIADWGRLHDTNVTKVSLPGYPFKRFSHWHTQSRKASAERISCPGLSNISDYDGIKYKQVMKRDNIFLQEHKVQGSEIMPGVLCLELAIKAAGQANHKEQVCGLKNIVWMKPMSFMKEEQVEIHLNQGNSYQFSIGIKDQGVHVQGNILYECRQRNIKNIDTDRIKAMCSSHLEHEEFYHKFEQAGFQYGSIFRTIQTIWFNGTTAFSKIRIDENVLPADHFTLHPSILEGALQTAGYLVNLYNGSGQPPAVPFTIERLEIYERLPLDCFAIAESDSGTQDGKTRYTNITITDLTGHVLVRIYRYAAKQFIHKSWSDIFYYEPKWLEKQVVPGIQDNTKLFIVLAGDNELVELIKKKAVQPVIWVKTGAVSCKKGKEVYEINPYEKEGYEKLLKDIKKITCSSVTVIQCSFTTEQISWNEQEIRRQADSQIIPVLLFYKAFYKEIELHDFTYLYFYPVHNPIACAMNGFTRSLNRENSRLYCRMIGIHGCHELLPAIIREAFCKSNDVDVRYQHGKRLVKTIKECSLKQLSNNRTFKNKGVYWITGGMGGMGYQIAEYLSKQYGAVLILIGRTPASPDIQARVDELNQMGGTVVYLSGDITSKEAVRQIYQESKKISGNIDGILHCAGLTKDKLAHHKSYEELWDVLDAKITGTLLLDQVTKKEKLDFFILFSSITAQFGNVGQSDYAYANSFLDSFAEFRNRLMQMGKRKGHAVSVNWPLLKDGTIATKQTVKNMEQNLKLKAMNTDEVISLLEKADISCHQVIMALKGDKDGIEKAFRLKDNSDPVLKNSNTPESIHENQLLEILIKETIQIAAEISHLNPAEIQMDSDLEKLGFDSIVMIEFANELQKKYQVDFSPAVFFEIGEATIYHLCRHILNQYGEDLLLKKTK